MNGHSSSFFALPTCTCRYCTSLILPFVSRWTLPLFLCVFVSPLPLCPHWAIVLAIQYGPCALICVLTRKYVTVQPLLLDFESCIQDLLRSEAGLRNCIRGCYSRVVNCYGLDFFCLRLNTNGVSTTICLYLQVQYFLRKVIVLVI